MLNPWVQNQQMQTANYTCKFTLCGEVEYLYVSLLTLHIKNNNKIFLKKQKERERGRERWKVGGMEGKEKEKNAFFHIKRQQQ